MRTFNYLEDYALLSSSVKGYITQLSLELEYLINTSTNKEIYLPLYDKVKKFKEKYPNLSDIARKINKDLVTPENVEYCLLNGKYPNTASKIGLEVENDLKDLIDLEGYLQEYTALLWQQKLTKFNNIINGKDFMIVAHASYNLPGLQNDANYKPNHNLYLSCSLFSNKELNSFLHQKLLFVVDVNKENYIASSSVDCVTADFDSPSFQTMKTIESQGKKHYIKVGYTNDSQKCVTALETPEMVEKLSVARELQENGKFYSYTKSQCNEVVLDRTQTKYLGAILLSNGCDLLISEYLELKKNHIPFKCVNIQLYRNKLGMNYIEDSDYQEYLQSLSNLENELANGFVTVEQLTEYYNEVVLPMQYDEVVKNDFMQLMKKYTDYIEL